MGNISRRHCILGAHTDTSFIVKCLAYTCSVNASMHMYPDRHIDINIDVIRHSHTYACAFQKRKTRDRDSNSRFL